MLDFSKIQDHDKIPITFLTLVIQSAFIPNTKIISTMLITKPSLGKTTYLELLKQFDFVEYTIDITPKRIADFLDDVDDGKKKFLVLPDFITNTAHSRRTVELARSIFREMMQSGVSKISIYGMEKTYRNSPKAGLITAITTDLANSNTRHWRSDGFYSRFLPFSYNHNGITENKILDNKWKLINPFENTRIEINQKPKAVSVSEPMNFNILQISRSVIEPVDAPYRSYDLINALCKSHAVLSDRDYVNQEDINTVIKIKEYINRKHNSL